MALQGPVAYKMAVPCAWRHVTDFITLQVKAGGFQGWAGPGYNRIMNE